MSFPTTGLIDTGARIENPLSDGSKWSRAWGSTTDWRSDGTKMIPGTPPRSATYRNNQTYGPDLELYFKVHPATVNALSTGIFLATASPTLTSWAGYVLHVYPDLNQWTFTALLRRDVGAWVTLGVWIDPLGAIVRDGSELGLERRGALWTCYHNGVAIPELTALTDNTYPTVGSVGMFGDDASGTIYQFGGGTLASTGAGAVIAAASHHASPRSYGGRR